MQCKEINKENNLELETGFINPPDIAKPRVWWHWTGGYITKEGIRADLEWMHRIGLGGFHIFECSSFDIASSYSPGSKEPPMPDEKRLRYMTPEWKDAFLFATKLADSLGFEMTIHSTPGFSMSGGPWVTPAKAMKKLVWSEIRLKGGEPFNGTLPEPPSTSGAFQNISGHWFRIISKKEFYADNAVIAYRMPEKDIPLIELKPVVTSSGGKFDLIQLTDGDLAKISLLPAAKVGEKAWVQFEFSKPEVIKSLTIASTGSGGQLFGSGFPDYRALEASVDGKTYRNVVNIPGGSVGQQTITFAPTTARFFKFTFRTRSSEDAENKIAEMVLHPVARVNHFEEKAAFTIADNNDVIRTPAVDNDEAISKADVVDLTLKMRPDGTLDWNPPPGNWTVIRFGYSLTGRQNHPAPPEATGLEVDKLNAGHVKSYFDHYLAMYQDASGGLMGKKGLQNMLVDSYEAGVQNWTEKMINEFKTRRGYDILPWMPVLTGKIVENAEASERFLWDFRKTIADLTAENFYDQLTSILKERGMGSYFESHEGGRANIADGMEVKRKSSIPMSAIWAPREPGGPLSTVNVADIRESASVAHIYGKNIVAAESMTANGTVGHWNWFPNGTAWNWSPEALNPIADLALSSGLNRFVIHSTMHQPFDDMIPGLTLGRYGLWFNRHETWAEKASPWITYMARCCFMLQQGKFIADIIYFYGEDNNITALFGNKLPDIPEGYNYDFVNADALVNLLSVDKGQIITPGGMCYKVLALDPNSQRMSFPVLSKINDMVKDGAIIVGPKPVGPAGLLDDQAKFKTIADQLWGTGSEIRKIGKGRVYAGQTLKEVMNVMKMTPDFSYTKTMENSNILFVHRKVDDVDIYWVSNGNNQVEYLDTKFRVEGKVAELWYPETGKIEPASYEIAKGLTRVPLLLEPKRSLFVVFRKKAVKPSVTLSKPEETQLAIIDGPWNLSFQPERGAPAQITIEELTSWSDNPNPGVKYFSGTATYTKKIQAPESWFNSGGRLWLDLGEVKNLAEVLINDKTTGIVWRKPFRVDVTDVIKKGENKLEIKVTNLWVNRLIGDLQPGIAKKYTYIATLPLHKPDSPLLLSGLLGPVRIVQ